jgi:hypothetical protein
MYVRNYIATLNLGDAIQTYALARLLPDASAWPGDRLAKSQPYVVNGWLGRGPIPATQNTVFAGVFVSSRTPRFYDWIARSACRPVGARDLHTLTEFKSRSMSAELIGCAALTLPRYDGPRHGVLRIDDGSPDCETQIIPASLSWEKQWLLAIRRLHQLREASLVFTTRLHVVLPCLAMGTPVVWQPRGDEAEARFSLLADMGVPVGQVNSFDVRPWADRYRQYLSQQLAINVVEREPTLPLVESPAKIALPFNSVLRGGFGSRRTAA